MSPTQIFLDRLYGGVSHGLAPLSHAIASVIFIDLTHPICLKRGLLLKKILYPKKCKKEVCPKAPSQQTAATRPQIMKISL
jgi:hypothetical protein